MSPLSAKGLPARLALSAGALLLALLAAEILVRVRNIAPERYPRPTWEVRYRGAFRPSNIWGNGLFKRDSRFLDLGVRMGEYVPGAAIKCRYATNPRGYFDDDGGVIMTVDALGMRSRATPTPPEKPAGTYRVLVLGDSFTFGVGVRDADTFCRRLETKLTARHERPVDVLNAGVQGYNTRDEVLYLEKQWLGLDPDLVLIVFYLNDAYDDSTILNNGEALGIYETQPGGPARVSRLWDLAQHKLRARRASRAVEEFYQRHFFADADSFLEAPGQLRVDWAASKTALVRAADLAEAHGFQLGLVMFPELYRLKGGYPFGAVHKLVAATCTDLGIPVLDLYGDVFEGQHAPDLWVHPSDHHPNEIAHRMVADAMAVFCETLGIDYD